MPATIYKCSGIRECITAFCIQTFRGFEFCAPVANFINASLVLAALGGKAVAPFLSSATHRLFPDTYLVGVFLTLLCLVQVVLFVLSMERGGFTRHLKSRAVFQSVHCVFYLLLTAAVLTGQDPPIVSGRYIVSALFSICASGTILGLLKHPRTPNYK